MKAYDKAAALFRKTAAAAHAVEALSARLPFFDDGEVVVVRGEDAWAIRDALDIHRAAGAAKPLAWRRPKDDGQDFGHEEAVYVADGIGGLYAIDSEALLWWAHDPFTWTKFGSIDEAKAAAERDWQERYSALSSRP